MSDSAAPDWFPNEGDQQYYKELYPPTGIPNAARLTEYQILNISSDALEKYGRGLQWKITLARAAEDNLWPIAYQKGLDDGEDSAVKELELLGRHNRELRAEVEQLRDGMVQARRKEDTMAEQRDALREKEHDWNADEPEERSASAKDTLARLTIIPADPAITEALGAFRPAEDDPERN